MFIENYDLNVARYLVHAVLTVVNDATRTDHLLARHDLEERLRTGPPIVAEPMPVHRTGVLTRGNFRHSDDAVIPSFRRIVEPVKDAGNYAFNDMHAAMALVGAGRESAAQTVLEAQRAQRQLHVPPALGSPKTVK